MMNRTLYHYLAEPASENVAVDNKQALLREEPKAEFELH